MIRQKSLNANSVVAHVFIVLCDLINLQCILRSKEVTFRRTCNKICNFFRPTEEGILIKEIVGQCVEGCNLRGLVGNIWQGPLNSAFVVFAIVNVNHIFIIMSFPMNISSYCQGVITDVLSC